MVAKHFYFIGCTERTPRLELCTRELLVVVCFAVLDEVNAGF